MTKKYSEISGSSEDFALPLLSEKVGQNIEILSVRFGRGIRGRYAVVTLDDKQEYRTSSKVLLSQLEDVAEFIADDGVVAHLARKTSKKGRKYLVFE